MPIFEDSFILLSEQYMPSMKKKFPFESIFASDPVKIFSPTNDDVYLAKAGIDSLKSFLDSSIDLEKNYDLVGVAFNAFVVNRANKNDQIISTEVALSSVENFKFKPMNIEHKRKEVVGMITGYGFSEFGTDKPLTLEEVKNTKEPFNVVLSGFVWRVVDPEFSEKLETSSDPSSLTYLSISTSWEMGFKDFSIVKGGKNLIESETINEEERVEELKSKLLHFGGSGKDEDGSNLYLNLIGEVLPLGIGFTMRPAADVKGVKVSGSKDLIELKNEENEVDSSQGEENNVKSNIQEKNASLKESEILISNIEKNMIIKSVNDITDESIKQVLASDIRTVLEEEIKKASEKFSEEIKEKEALADKVEEEKIELQKKLEEVVSMKEAFEKELSEIKTEIAAKQKAEDFQARMSSLDEEFNLTDEDRQIIGEQIKDMDSEQFENWYKSFNVFAKSKIKNTAEENKEIAASEVKNETESKAEKEELASKAIEEAVAENSTLPNASTNNTESSLRDRYAKAFNNQTIKINSSNF
jgi:hypothetical protein